MLLVTGPAVLVTPGSVKDPVSKMVGKWLRETSSQPPHTHLSTYTDLQTHAYTYAHEP